MSRLLTHQRKQTNKKIYLLIAIVIFMVFSFYFIGFDTLVNTALLFTKFSDKKSKTTLNNSKNIEYRDLNILTPQEATNSAEIALSGRAIGFDQIDVYVNEKNVKSIDISKEAEINEKIQNLEQGINKIYLIGKVNNSDITKKTTVYTIIYKVNPPNLTLLSPKPDETVHSQNIIVSGEIEKNTTLSLNDVPVVVDFQGKFSTTHKLEQGDNTLQFKATDFAGNTTNKSIHVKFEREE